MQTKAVMNEWMAAHRKTRSKIPDGMRSDLSERSDSTSVINGADQAFPHGETHTRFNPLSVHNWPSCWSCIWRTHGLKVEGLVSIPSMGSSVGWLVAATT